MSRCAPVVLVTGASRGIGAATAVVFARAGWRVAITARTQTEGQTLDHQLRRRDGTLLTGSLASTADAVRATGAAVFAQPMDLMDRASLDAAADAVLAHYGHVDLLINNAVYQDRETNAMLLDTDDDVLARTFYGNVSAPLRLVRRLLPSMIAQGGGQIINVSSGAGKNDPPAPANQGGWGFAYGASKAALARMAGCLNREHGRDGIRAFSVNPGVVATQALSAALGDGGEIEKRYGAMKPEAIATALHWLATDARAVPLATRTVMLDLQDLVREYALSER